MSKSMTVASLQMISAPDLEKNLDTAQRLIGQAAKLGARMVLLPEYFCVMGLKDTDKLGVQEAAGEGPIQDFLADAARELGIWIVGGTVPVVTFDQAHGPIRSVGYRIGPVAYSSDVSDLDEAALAAVAGCKLWIVDALRYAPHPTHAHLDQALAWIAAANVERAVLTNLHIDMDYKALSALVPDNVEVGFDGCSRVIG